MCLICSFDFELQIRRNSSRASKLINICVRLSFRSEFLCQSDYSTNLKNILISTALELNRRVDYCVDQVLAAEGYFSLGGLD